MSWRLRSSALVALELAIACDGRGRPPHREPPSDETAAGGAAGAPPTSDGGAVSSLGGVADPNQNPAPSLGAGAQPTDLPDASGGAGGGGPVDLDPFAGVSRCTSQTFRDPNESEAPEMNPGFACITCHTAFNTASGEGDAPIFAFAGTLYPTAHEPSSCTGADAKGAEVVLQDATGAELHAVANTSGNFLLEAARLMPPFSAKVVFEGRERAATTPHSHGDCNACHTQQGAQGAPGRVVLP